MTDGLHCTGPTEAAGILRVIVLGVESMPNGLDCKLFFFFETESNYIDSLEFTMYTRLASNPQRSVYLCLLDAVIFCLQERKRMERRKTKKERKRQEG